MLNTAPTVLQKGLTAIIGMIVAVLAWCLAVGISIGLGDRYTGSPWLVLTPSFAFPLALSVWLCIKVNRRLVVYFLPGFICGLALTPPGYIVIALMVSGH